MKKPVPLEQAVAMVPDGAVVMAGGFMGVGSPMRLMAIQDVIDATAAALTLGAALR